MKITHLLILFFFHYSVFTFCQSYSSLTCDSIILEFVKLNTFSKNLDNIIVQWNRCDLFIDTINCRNGDLVGNEKDAIFTSELLSEFQNHFLAIKHNGLKSFPIKGKNQNIIHHSRVSIPLLSNDGKFAIIKYEFWVGNEISSGEILILKKKNKKWIKIGSRCEWIS